jgi:hypothetical protein
MFCTTSPPYNPAAEGAPSHNVPACPAFRIHAGTTPSCTTCTPPSSNTPTPMLVLLACSLSLPVLTILQIVNNSRAGETYLLYQCGTPNPQTANTELDLPAGTKVFQIPLVSVAVTDSNAAGFLVSVGTGDLWDGSCHKDLAISLFRTAMSQRLVGYRLSLVVDCAHSCRWLSQTPILQPSF